MRSPPSRILILTADIGEGHDLPARATAAELADAHPDVEVTIVNALREMGRVLRLVLRDGSWLVLRRLPALFELQYLLAARLPPTRWLTRQLLYALGRRRLIRRIEEAAPDVVVSTYPGVTAVLGELRRRRRLDLPVYSVITDLAGLQYWAHPGVDLHFVTHPESVEEVERIAGPGSARWARPPTSPAFFAPMDRASARRGLGLPPRGKVVVVSGGGWAVGDLAGAVEAALGADAAATVVCLTGHNEELHSRLDARFGAHPRVRTIAFTDRMGELLSAADALVHTTAGLTVLEAIIRGCPVISYGFSFGHVRLNDAAFERFGLATTARSTDDLATSLKVALERTAQPDPSFARRRPIASFVLNGERRVVPLPVWRLRARQTALAAAVGLLLTATTLSTDGAYAVLARALDLRPLTHVSTSRREVGLLLDAPPAAVPALTRELTRTRAHASFAVEGTLAHARLAQVSGAGDDTIPRLRGTRALGWIRTKPQLRRSANRLGLPRRFFYAVPHDGFTMGQYLLAYAAGARPVSGAVRYGSAGPLRGVHAGDIVELSPRRGAASWTAAVARVIAECRRAGLEPVSVSALVTARGR